MDVDGVLTDGTVSLDEASHESKRISFTDVMGISLARQAGLELALISGEGGPLFDVIASKLGITDTYPHCRDKAAALQAFALRRGLEVAELCYVGDDVNDIPAMQICGLAVAPADAHPSVRAVAAFGTSRAGGLGCVRELVDRLLDGQPGETGGMHWAPR